MINDVEQWLESIRDNQSGTVNARLADHDDRKTALHMAAQHNNVQVANLLLNANAGKESSSCILLCCIKQHVHALVCTCMK